jgi:hypothetical protein
VYEEKNSNVHCDLVVRFANVCKKYIGIHRTYYVTIYIKYMCLRRLGGTSERDKLVLSTMVSDLLYNRIAFLYERKNGCMFFHFSKPHLL